MRKKSPEIRMFTRRAFVIGGLQICALGLISLRLAWLQLSQGQRYKTLSDKNRINMKILPPVRGNIVDRFGVPLAVNNQNFRVMVTAEQTKSIEQSVRKLAQYIKISETQIEKVLKQSKKTSKFVPVEIRDDLTWKEVAKVEVNLPDLPGISIGEGEVRNYPYGKSMAHIIGYVGMPAEADIEENPLLRLPGFKIGKNGIEKQHDTMLRGAAGNAEIEVNVVGREVRELNRREGQEGARVMLSIDAELQRFTRDRLAKERSASAVIMDTQTGAVYASASHPSFDPNLFTYGISAPAWQELLADIGHPLTNKAIAGQYPPASTFKMITALAGLRTGKITTNTTSFCSGRYDFGNGKFHCWKRGGHGWVGVNTAIMKSCDVFFYEAATEIGINEIAKTARQFGLGEKLGFDVPGERPGLVPDTKWKLGYMNNKWQQGETIIASIGQGYLLATPLQLAVMTARLVNGGYAVKPWVTAAIDDKIIEHPKSWPKMDVDPSHLKLMIKGMDDVVNHKRGTAHGSVIKEEAFAMGGKTGTAQVKRITMEDRRRGVKNEELDWKSRHHALFVGYAPLHKPRYVCSVVVEHGIGGSRTAAPIARDLLLEAQKRAPADSPLQISTGATPIKSPAKNNG